MKSKIAKQHRQAEFRELARDIVWQDRDKRKYGRAVDTAGSIARALEKAYQRGRKEEREGGVSRKLCKRPWLMFQRKESFSLS